jgi:hypothetical protein
MEGEILSSMAHIFLVKGNDVEVFSLMPILKFDPENPNLDSPSRARMKELLDEGYELAVDDGSEKSKMMKSTIKRNSFMAGRGFDYLSSALGDKAHEKVFRNVKSLAKYVPSIVGFSTPIGAIASGLLYAGTSKPAGANIAMEPYEGVYATKRSILDTPITAANRNLYDQIGVDTSLGPSPQISGSFDRDPVGFDRYMQNKIQNQQNTQGIMNAKPRPVSNYTTPDRGDWGPGLHLYRGGIASLRR